MDTITITQDGRTVALAGRERFWLAVQIHALPDGHPRRRHVCFMAVYARDILTGDMPGPYTDTDADHFARFVTNTGGVTPSRRSHQRHTATVAPRRGAGVASHRPACQRSLHVEGESAAAGSAIVR
jgi:hypothetical protein